MKIFLVSASSEYAETENRSDNKALKEQYPLGIAYLASILEKDKHNVKLFNFFNKPMNSIEKSFFKDIDSEQPDIIGFSILSMNRVSSFKLVNIIKKKYPMIKIIVGGIHCSTLYEQILRNYPVDVVCIGEGDQIINSLVKNINNSLLLRKVPGIAFLNNKELIITESPKLLMELDSLPYPKHESFLNKDSRLACMITSRGCPGRCTFCSTSAYWRVCRQRSAKNVVDEIEHIKKNFPHISRFFMYDDTFTLDNKRVIDICKGIIDRKIKISWRCVGRVHPISKEMLKWMKLAGCNNITFGVESGSEKILNSIKKFITKEQIINAYKLTRASDLKSEIFLIVGLPGESEKTIDETIKFLKILGVSVPGIGILELYPNTEVYRLAKKQGFIDDDYWLSDKKIPIYTYEHSLSILTKMKFKMIFESFKNKNIFSLMLFALKKVLFEPRVIFNYLKVRYSKTKSI